MVHHLELDTDRARNIIRDFHINPTRSDYHTVSKNIEALHALHDRCPIQDLGVLWQHRNDRSSGATPQRHSAAGANVACPSSVRSSAKWSIDLAMSDPCFLQVWTVRKLVALDVFHPGTGCSGPV